MLHIQVSFVRACFFFFNDTATTEIYTLSLHDALPICARHALDAHDRDLRRARVDRLGHRVSGAVAMVAVVGVDGAVLELDLDDADRAERVRSEEHTSELQSQSNLVCRLLLEKKKKKKR